MNLTSLNRTLPQVEYIEPIYINDYERAWNAREDKTKTLSTTYLGVEKKDGSKINCIIFEVPEEELERMDQREFLYTRELVSIEKLEILEETNLNITANDKIWIYKTNTPKSPGPQQPLIQSYIDVCLSGCMDLEIKFKTQNFALEFISLTKNWSENWVNDRIYPRAPHIHQPYAYKIDAMLSSALSSLYERITIE